MNRLARLDGLRMADSLDRCWSRPDVVVSSSDYGDDVKKVTFTDGTIGLILWRPAARCWRLIDLAGYDHDRLPDRIIANERRTS